jgi:hypothetical protein
MPFWNRDQKMKTPVSSPDGENSPTIWSRVSLEGVFRDVRHAFRMMRRNPGFAAIVMLTLAVAIGANTALFSVVDGVLLQALPYRNSQQLVQVYATHPQATEAPVTPAEFYEYRAQNRSFEDMALLSFFEHEYYGPKGPEQIPS